MALKSCKECGKPVSTKADKCPACGVKNPARTHISTPAGCLIILIVTAVIFSFADTSTTPDPPPAPQHPLIGQCGYNRSDDRLLGPVVRVNGDQVTVRHPEIGLTDITYPRNLIVRPCPE